MERGRKGKESVAAVQENHVRLEIGTMKPLEAGDGDESMGIWEAGPTAVVYSPASRETRFDRLLFLLFCQGRWVPPVPY